MASSAVYVIFIFSLVFAECHEYQFKCESGNRESIPSIWICDLDDDCEDGSDEVNCPYNNYCDSSPCLNGATCRNGKEVGCTCRDGFYGTTCETECISPDYFECPAKSCIISEWICDGDNDCGDRSDETNCQDKEDYCTKSHQHLCSSGICLSAWQLCNGEADCDDNSDEANCARTTSVGPLPGWQTFECVSPDYFQCPENRCVRAVWVCDDDDDCDDGSDEADCKRN